jgi:hypothetical protein
VLNAPFTGCGDGGSLWTALPGDGGGGGHTSDLVSSEIRAVSLAPDHDARVLVG